MSLNTVRYREGKSKRRGMGRLEEQVRKRVRGESGVGWGIRSWGWEGGGAKGEERGREVQCLFQTL